MSYRFRRKESVPAGIRRIALEQAEKAARELAGGNPDLSERIHNARQSFKKCHSLRRLVRDELGSERYQAENRWLREAKNRLASARDADAMIETFDKRASGYRAVGDCRAFVSLREGLVECREPIGSENQDLEQTARSTAELLRDVQHRIEQWDLSADDFDALAPGLKRLSHLLGDDHDLGVLCHTLRENAQALEGDADTLMPLAHHRQGVLRREARSLGASRYAQKPGRQTARLRSWRLSRSCGARAGCRRNSTR